MVCDKFNWQNIDQEPFFLKRKQILIMISIFEEIIPDHDYCVLKEIVLGRDFTTLDDPDDLHVHYSAIMDKLDDQERSN